MDAGPLNADIAELAAAAGLPAGGLRIDACAGGGNNRVFVVHAGGERVVAKWYFRHPSDTRDRLAAEYAFLEYAAGCGVRSVPRPLSCDPARGLALYEFVEGRRIDAGEVGVRHVDAAAAFFLAINAPAGRAAAARLPFASEACFSIAEHLALVEARIARLDGIDGSLAVGAEARAFVGELRAAWEGIRAGLSRAMAASAPGAATDVLDEASRCVSPSDFGFHNALERPDGTLCFLDFEYAGRDDPAKMAGDFFAHPAVPVPPALKDRFIGQTMAFAPDAPALAARARLLEPVFRTKWCCIMLNEFLPDAAQRRRFADPGADSDARRRLQLDKARRHLPRPGGH
jgi:hypothetical protein